MKQHITVPRRQPGESEEAWAKRVEAWSKGDDVRTKTDLRGFKSCDFSLDNSPIFTAQQIKRCRT